MDDAVSYLRNMGVKRWIKRALERTECESVVKEVTARIEEEEEEFYFPGAAPLLCEEIQYPVCGFLLVYSFNKYSIFI